MCLGFLDCDRTFWTQWKITDINLKKVGSFWNKTGVTLGKVGTQFKKLGHNLKSWNFGHSKKTGHIYPPRRVIGSDSLATNRIFGSLWNKTKKPDVTLKRSGHFEIKRTSPLKGRRLDIFFQKSSNLWKKSFNSLLWRVWGTFSARLDFS